MDVSSEFGIRFDFISALSFSSEVKSYSRLVFINQCRDNEGD